MINQTCLTCSGQFSIAAADETFYKKVAAPHPKNCPRCRLQRRLAFRNERALYPDECDKCHKAIISLYEPKSHLTVYCQTCWWGDDWDPADYGQDIDWSRSLLEQYLEVRKRVPRLALVAMNSENSGYTNMCADNKDCYLLFAAENNENCSYGKLVQKCKDCFDNCFIYDSELLYECINCRNCYRSIYLQDCQDSRECGYSIGLKGCSNVWLSNNLHNKQYYIRNKPVKPEDYPKLVAGLQECYVEWRKLNQDRIVKYANTIKSDDCTGDYLTDCKRVYDSYDVTSGQDIRYCTDALTPKDSYDCSFFYYNPELCYNCLSMLETYNVHYSTFIFYARDVEYGDQVHNSHDILLSSCVRNKQYLILNKAYSETLYKELQKKCIEKMTADGEYGELPPISHSLFAYADTVAQEYFQKDMQTVIDKSFKFTRAEQAFYDLMKLPQPTEHPELRHRRRMALRNPRTLWERQCMNQNCHNRFHTTYAPDSVERVYCETCYQQVMY
ncbi:MAG: hypothetical protein ACD_41C00101G0006 [uncultured bacterium]|nr:MAG: hypothetical protein ACD_41C00101G0006 [uncultured bacterium]HBY74146.1 hypothetical protein [Candidatus Kerfeldbacteria bacterium]